MLFVCWLVCRAPAVSRRCWWHPAQPSTAAGLLHLRTNSASALNHQHHLWCLLWEILGRREPTPGGFVQPPCSMVYSDSGNGSAPPQVYFIKDYQLFSHTESIPHTFSYIFLLAISAGEDLSPTLVHLAAASNCNQSQPKSLPGAEPSGVCAAFRGPH